MTTWTISTLYTDKIDPASLMESMVHRCTPFDTLLHHLHRIIQDVLSKRMDSEASKCTAGLPFTQLVRIHNNNVVDGLDMGWRKEEAIVVWISFMSRMDSHFEARRSLDCQSPT
jgi:hypothetical protein